MIKLIFFFSCYILFPLSCIYAHRYDPLLGYFAATALFVAYRYWK